MKTVWDYTKLAESYKKRAKYSNEALKKMFDQMGLINGCHVCDIGAGLGHLTLPLLKASFQVTAVEPNDAMRAIGKEKTLNNSQVDWVEATAENTKQKDSSFEAAMFGSSFNVCNKDLALKEAHRIVKSGGWFACMWNHRDLKDPIQSEIENIISKYLSSYDYGDRRQSQTSILNESPLLKDVFYICERFFVEQDVEESIEAWYSHGTLERQTGDKFEEVVKEIATFLRSLNTSTIKVPYETKIWIAQFVDK